MRKHIRKYFVVALCLVLLLAMTNNAAASIYSWDDGNVGKTIILTIRENGYRNQAVDNYRPYQHYQNKGTTYISNYGSFSASLAAQYTSTSYYSALSRAFSMEGMRFQYSFSGTFNSTLSVPSNATSGIYTLGVQFDTKSGTWEISSGSLVSGRAVPGDWFPIEDGEVYYAPVGSIYGYIVMAVP